MALFFTVHMVKKIVENKTLTSLRPMEMMKQVDWQAPLDIYVTKEKKNI